MGGRAVGGARAHACVREREREREREHVLSNGEAHDLAAPLYLSLNVHL